MNKRYLVEICLHQQCAARTNTFLKADDREEAKAIAEAILYEKYYTWDGVVGLSEVLHVPYSDSFIRITPYDYR